MRDISKFIQTCENTIIILPDDADPERIKKMKELSKGKVPVYTQSEYDEVKRIKAEKKKQKTEEKEREKNGK